MASIDNNEVNISTNSQEVSVSTERPEVSITIERNTPTVSVNRAEVTVSSNNNIYEVGFYNLTDEQIEKIAALASVNISVVDSLDSEDSTKALSARQGKILNDKISSINLGDFDLSDYATKAQLEEVISNVYTKEDVTTLLNSLAEIIDTKLTVVDLTDANGNIIGKATTSNFGVNGTLYANDVNIGGVSLTSTIDSKVQSAKDALSNAIDSLSSDLTSTIDGLSDDIENVNTEIINTNNAVSTVSANVATLESDLQTTNDTLDTTVRLTTNTGKSLVTLYDWIEANFDRSVTDYIATRKPLVSSGDVAAFGAGVVDGGGSSSGTGASAMNQLTDVLLSNLSDKDILQYNTSKSKWINTQIESSVTSSEKENWNEAASWVNSIKGSDTDGIVNKWDEIVKFVDGFSTSTSLATEFKKYLPLSGGAMTGTLTMKDGQKFDTGYIGTSLVDGYIGSAIRYGGNKAITAGNYHSFMSMKMYNGGYFTMGGVGDNFMFRYHNASDISSSNNLGTWSTTWGSGGVLTHSGIINATNYLQENGTALSSKYLQLSGGTMTGDININKTGVFSITHSNDIYICPNGTGNGLIVDSVKCLTPVGSWKDTASIGTSTYKWKDAYFSGTVNATTFSGNATSATKLATARTIWGQSFDGSANITAHATIPYIYLRDTSTDCGVIGKTSTTSDDLYFHNYKNSSLIFGTNNSTRMIIGASGDIGIGTTSPAYKLDVSGTGRFTGNLTVPKINNIPISSSGSSLIIDGDIICTGDVVAQGSLTYTTNAQLAAVQDDVAALTASTMSLQATNDELVSENNTLKDELSSLKDTVSSLTSKISKLNLE